MAVVKNLMVRIGADASGIVKGMKDAWKSTWVSSDKIKQATSGSSKAVGDACKNSNLSLRSYTAQVKKLKVDHAAAVESVAIYGDKLKQLKETYGTIENATDGLDLSKSLTDQIDAAGAELDALEIKIEKTKRKILTLSSGKMTSSKSEHLELLKQELGELMYQSDQTAEHYRALASAAKNVGADNMEMASAAGLKKLAAEILTTEARLKATQEVADKTGEKLKHLGGSPAIAGLKRIGSAATAATKAGVKGLGKSIGNLAKDGARGLASIPGRLLHIGKSASNGSNGVTKILTSIKRLGVASLGLRVTSGLFGRLRSVVSSYVSQNETLNNTVKQLKDQLGQALAPAINVVISAVQALMPLVQRVSGVISSVMTAIGGKLAATTEGIKETADEAAEAADGLYGFDQITKENDGTSDSGASMPSVADAKAPEGLLAWIEKLKSAFTTKDWKDFGDVIAQGLNSCVNSIRWPDIKSKVSTWISGCTDGINGFIKRLDFGAIGSKISGGLNTITSSISEFIKGIDWSTIGSGIGEGITSFFSGIDWNNCEDLLTNGLDRILQLTSGFASGFAPLQGIDFSGATSSLQSLLQSTIDFAKTVGTTLADAYDRVLKPLLGWTIEAAVPAIVDVLTESFRTLSAIAEPVINGISGFMEAIEPVTTFIGNVAIGCLDGLKDTFSKVGEVFEDKGSKISNIVMGIGEIINIVWTRLEPGLTVLKETVGAVFGYIRDVVVNALGQVIDILSGVIDFVVGVFTLDFKRAFGGIADIFKSTLEGIKKNINAVINLINGLISGICSGINVVIKGINKISFNVPDWVPGIGGKTLGFDIKTITAPKIPLLEKGMVATKPTMGIFAENGAEAVVPLENNIGWIKKVAARLDENRPRGNAGEGIVLTIPIYVGGRKITERVIKDINDITKTTGECPIYI